jgi:hypothetical protein
MDPMQRMIDMTKEAYVDPRKRALLPRMQQQLWDMTRAQLPGTYQSNTPMNDPVISDAQARLFSTARDDAHFRPETNNSAVLNRMVGRRDPVHGARPGEIAGAPVYEQPAPTAHDAPDTQLFLANVINRQKDDVFREVSYKIIDGMGLKVGMPSDDMRLTLVNPKTKNSVTFDEREFIQAVAFIADRKRTMAIDINPESKTAQLLHLFSHPDTRSRLRRWFGGELPGDIPPNKFKVIIDQNKAWIALQDRLNWLRKELRVVTGAPPVRSLVNTLSLGILDKPGDGVTPERLAQVVPPAERAKLAELLSGMREKNILDWNDQAEMIDGATKHRMKGTNLYNILSNLFDPGNSTVSQGHNFTYVATGSDEFVQKLMEYRQVNGQLSAEVVAAAERASQGKAISWTTRVVNGTAVSLVKMWRIYSTALKLAGTAAITLTAFVAAMQSMGLVDFEWHAWYSWVCLILGIGNQNAVTVYSEGMLAPILNYVDQLTGYKIRAPVQGFISSNSQLIGQGIVASFVSMAGMIAAWAKRRVVG